MWYTSNQRVITKRIKSAHPAIVLQSVSHRKKHRPIERNRTERNGTERTSSRFAQQKIKGWCNETNGRGKYYLTRICQWRTVRSNNSKKCTVAVAVIKLESAQTLNVTIASDLEPFSTWRIRHRIGLFIFVLIA